MATRLSGLRTGTSTPRPATASPAVTPGAPLTAHTTSRATAHRSLRTMRATSLPTRRTTSTQARITISTRARPTTSTTVPRSIRLTTTSTRLRTTTSTRLPTTSTTPPPTITTIALRSTTTGPSRPRALSRAVAAGHRIGLLLGLVRDHGACPVPSSSRGEGQLGYSGLDRVEVHRESHGIWSTGFMVIQSQASATIEALCRTDL